MRHMNGWMTLALLAAAATQAASPQTAAPQASAVQAAPAASATLPGKAGFDRWCAECHAPGHGHPGTQQLERIRGVKLAVLEQRTDLTPALVRTFVRNGMNAMPAYRPSEISEIELEQIGAYLARNAPAVKRRL